MVKSWCGFKWSLMMNNQQGTAMRGAILFFATMLIGVPLFAQTDISGIWGYRGHQMNQERGGGPELVDYLGIPINDEARSMALNYDADILFQPERQCQYYTPLYVMLGPFGLNIWSETDPITGKIVAWKMGAWIDKDIVTIWMDGRPHPSKDALHTFAGFTTGVWDGDQLTTYSTHLKAGYLRRNGVPSSDQATLTQHIIRHGDIVSILAVMEDPIYTTEPYVLATSWELDPNATVPRTPSACEPINELPRLETEPARVSHHLPGKNPFINEVSKMYHLPMEAVLGGAETMYPEFRKKLKDSYVPLEKCERYCCGPITDPAVKCIRSGTGQVQ
jgi:hypothetical protein